MNALILVGESGVADASRGLTIHSLSLMTKRKVIDMATECLSEGDPMVRKRTIYDLVFTSPNPCRPLHRGTTSVMRSSLLSYPNRKLTRINVGLS